MTLSAGSVACSLVFDEFCSLFCKSFSGFESEISNLMMLHHPGLIVGWVFLLSSFLPGTILFSLFIVVT
ncbi:hypothetical protein BVRB_2g035310 [Beta vulgaris subsp. vulgaris]|nr:hypothetical protein BVRB_2g035310 [Beta vulgaris subsp. vulgaris]